MVVSLSYNPRNVLAQKTMDYILSLGLFKQVPSSVATTGKSKSSSRVVTSQPKVEMTEQEFRAKLAHSSAQGAAGQYIEMQTNETAEQFINRILCTQSV